MPGFLQSNNQVEQQTTNPPTVASQKKFNWKKVLVVVVAGALVLSAVVAGFYYYVSQNDLGFSIGSVEIKQASPSAKPATQSAETASPTANESETENWKTIESTAIGYSIKTPQSWLVTLGAEDKQCTPNMDFIAPTKDILGKCGSEFGGLIVITKREEAFSDHEKNVDTGSLKNPVVSNTKVDGAKAIKVTGTINFADDPYEMNGSDSIEYYVKYDDQVLVITYLRKPAWIDYSETFEKIVSTFKFI